MRPQRVVLDTSVVVSALVFGGGHPGRLRAAWQAGVFLPLASSATIKELARVLAYPKFRLDSAEREELLADYLPYTRSVQMPSPPPMVPICRDPFDVPFLHLAVAGKARSLVSGDRDLLALQGQVPFAILTLDAFIQSLGVRSA